MTSASPWTDERAEQLRQFWLAGLSAGKIARKLGLTRNAVIGKSQRLKLQPRCERWKGSRPWTEDEEAQLRAHWKTRQDVMALAKRLHRTLGACISYAHVLGLAPKPSARHRYE